MPVVYLSLGSNQGDREKNLKKAIEMIGKDEDVKVEKVSSIYRSSGVDKCEGLPEFLNSVVKIRTEKTPHELLGFCKSIEENIGRKRDSSTHSRKIDIDIILYDDEIIEEEDLTIPHPSATKRKFVLIPLSELKPDVRFPDLDKDISELLSALPEEDLVERIESELDEK